MQGCRYSTLLYGSNQVVWDVTPCRLVEIYRRFEVLQSLQLQRQAVQEEFLGLKNSPVDTD